MPLTQHVKTRHKIKEHFDRSKIIKQGSLNLHNLLDEAEIVKLHDAFNKEHGRRMNKEQLRDALYKFINIQYDEHTYDTVFNRMNFSCNGFVTWDEFISYLIIGFQQQEVGQEYKSLDEPIPTAPTMIKSNHRHSINRVTFFPTVKPDRSSNWHDGSIITCSSDGSINYWSLDMQLERTVQSSCPLLNIQSTWVTDMVVLADVSVICTSSSERDLRFYDTSARKFELRVMISSLPDAVMSMYYLFYDDINVPSKLVLGDMGGSIRVMFIETESRGIFRSQPGTPLFHAPYERIVKGLVPHVRVVEFPHLHSDYIRQVYYYRALHSVVSCAQCPKALIMTNIEEGKVIHIYKITLGVWCFTVETTTHLVATGGPDCLIRIWNSWLPETPVCSFYGHHYGIVQMVFQDKGKTLYSMSKDKCIKVWDMGAQTILQTYLGLPPELGEKTDLTALYNPQSRQLIIGSAMIAVLSLSPKQSPEHTDGNTHTSVVSVVLYNKLFKSIVTCGLDSYIITWDPWDGRRLMLTKEAHTVTVRGEIKPVEITAATFDPGYQRLLTGAHDGTLKIWNFNTGTCLRNMAIDKFCEIQSLIWVKGRIMATGWNKRVTEFSDTDVVGVGGVFSKNWDLRHTEDISSAVVREPETLATSSYNGDLILWRLETGQPYKKFNVVNPTSRIKIQYELNKTEEKPKDEYLYTRRRSSMKDTRKRSSTRYPSISSRCSIGGYRPSIVRAKGQKLSTMAIPDECFLLRKIAVHCMLFLNARRSEPNTGTLLVSLENGDIQVWNHHIAGGFVTSFHAVHRAGIYVKSMTTDLKNEFLFVGTTAGFLKAFLLKNYCVLPQDEEHICMPRIRLLFPFTWGDRFVGRAQRAVKHQPKPMLLNSYKGHFMRVSGLAYLDDCQILISYSEDFSARMWTIGGQYLQTIGTFKPWTKIDPSVPTSSYFQYSFPPDVRKGASSTTLRVLSGGTLPKRLTKKQLELRRKQKNVVDVDAAKIYGKPLKEQFLGKHYKIPERKIESKAIEFDTSFPYIPVYQHLIMPRPTEIEKPKSPSQSQS